MKTRTHRRKRTVWDRLLQAHKKGSGIRFSPEEVDRLMNDGALVTRAEMDEACFDSGHDPKVCNGDCG